MLEAPSSSPETASDPSRRVRRKQARPGELLQAALELFVDKGYAATRVEEVAQRAGVSKGTLFLYFASKEDLFKAVVRENISGRFPQWSLEVDSHTGTSADLLRRCVQEWWMRVGATKASGISKLIMSEAGNFPELATFYQQEVVVPGNELIRRILQRGVDEGEFKINNMACSIYAVLAPLRLLGLSQHSLGGQGGGCTPDLQTAEFLDVHVNTLLHGLCIQPGPAVQRPGPDPDTFLP